MYVQKHATHVSCFLKVHFVSFFHCFHILIFFSQSCFQLSNLLSYLQKLSIKTYKIKTDTVVSRLLCSFNHPPNKLISYYTTSFLCFSPTVGSRLTLNSCFSLTLSSRLTLNSCFAGYCTTKLSPHEPLPAHHHVQENLPPHTPFRFKSKL